jgi:CheY-like chemotaxis protein
MYTFGQINTNSSDKHHKQIIPANNNFINENGNYILKVNKREEPPVNKKININVDKNTNSDKKFNIILLDLHMPKLNGLEAARMIRQHSLLNKHSPIVLISANSSDLSAIDIKKSGIDFCLQKPIQ